MVGTQQRHPHPEHTIFERSSLFLLGVVAAHHPIVFSRGERRLARTPSKFFSIVTLCFLWGIDVL